MGSLDERNPSLWVGTSERTDFPLLADDLATDVAVVGGGIAGLMTAALCKRDGRRVVLLEADRLAAGATGYTTAKLTALHGLTYDELARSFGDEAARRYADANLAGMAQVATLVDECGIACDLQQQPAFTYTTDPASVDKIRAEVAAAQRIGLDASFTTECDLPYPVEGAVRLDNQAQFHPRRYCLGLAAAIDGDGSHVFERTRVTGVDDGDPCRVRTEHGTVTAQHVVVATHLPILDRGGYFARTYPMRSYALSASLDGPVPSGMYLSVDSPTRSVRPAVMDGREVVVLGGEGHKVGQDEDTRQRYAALEDWARSQFPVRSIDYRWSAQDFMPVDGVPFVGPVSLGSERVLVATGFRKWGMSNGAAAAILLSDRIAGRENPWAPLFDTNRLNLRQSVRELVKENADVVKRFIGDRIRTEFRRTPADLAPGEAAVVTQGAQRVAAYRDPAGTLHVVSAACTHMGCTVTWNTAETTWDCPCHGSRFTADGEVLEGPAVRPLERRDGA
jgi:glycine/D-amino acid oxidase-like deaminating enzyme/nitrite reductase/ring-hydroxylating ferredoxin subunit